MGRAQGANVVANFGFESTYGAAPGAGGANWFRTPFVSHDLGEVQNLLTSDLIGLGREAQAPVFDVVDNTGKLTTPIDLRNFGLILKLAFGNPVTSPGQAATGTLTFSAQPAANSTVTIAGTAVTFVASGATGSQVNIGADVNATVAALRTYLSGVGSGAINNQTYTAATNVLTITAKTAGPAANAVTLAAQAASNAMPSGATLIGGSNAHVFTSGAVSLPSAVMEFGFLDLSPVVWRANTGIGLDKMMIKQTRSGLLRADLDLIAQAELVANAPLAGGSPTALAVQRFAMASSYCNINGVPVASLVDTDFTYGNSLDKVETIRSDGRIEGWDPSTVMLEGNLKLRYRDESLYAYAISQGAVTVNFGWTLGNGRSLDFQVNGVYIPKAKRAVSGPGGIEVSLPIKAGGATNTVVATLNNDQAGY